VIEWIVDLVIDILILFESADKVGFRPGTKVIVMSKGTINAVEPPIPRGALKAPQSPMFTVYSKFLAAITIDDLRVRSPLE